MHVQSYCSAHETFCFTTFSLPLPSWFAKAPNCFGGGGGGKVGRVGVNCSFLFCPRLANRIAAFVIVR